MEEILKDLKEKLQADSWIDPDDLTLDEGKIFFAHDVFPENTSDENWSLYCEIQDELERFGWQIEDVYMEHDFISGDLREVKKEI